MASEDYSKYVNKGNLTYGTDGKIIREAPPNQIQPVEALTGKSEIMRGADGNLYPKTTKTVYPVKIASGSDTSPSPAQSATAPTTVQPLGGAQVTPIAGGKQNAFSGTTSPVIALNGKTIGDTTAISDRVNWSPGSRNAQAVDSIAGMNVKPSSFTSYGTQAQTDEFGRALPDKTIVKDLGSLSNRGDLSLTYDQQVAKADAINKNTIQQLGNISPKEQFDMGFVGAANNSNPSYKNAMLARETWAKNNANNQAELGRQNQFAIADTNAETQRYAADQSLAGHQIAGDAIVKAHEIQALGQQKVAQAKAGAEAIKVSNEQADTWLKSNGYELSPENRQSAITHANQMNNFYNKFGAFAVKNGITNPSDPRLITWRNIAQHAASGKPWDKSLGLAQEDYNQSITTLKNHGVVIPQTPSFTMAKKNEMPGVTQNPA